MTNPTITEEELTLKSADVWEVSSPPPSNTIKGHLVPKALSKFRRRRISVEVYSKKFEDKEITEVFVRFLDHSSHSKSKRIFVPSDDISYHTGDKTGTSVDGWVPKYKFPISSVKIDKRAGCACAITTISKHRDQVRNIIFDSEEEAITFSAKISKHKTFKSAVLATIASLGLSRPRDLTILIEIVSAKDLPSGDLNSSDPYVVIMLNGVAVHKTKYISNTLKPIWTVQTKSLFLLKTNTNNLFNSPDGMIHFEVRDYDALSKDTLLGISKVPASVIDESEGERLEYPVKKQRADGTERSKGTLFLRFRRATEHDISFMDKLEKGELKVQETARSKNGMKLKNILRKNVRTDGDGVIRHRARPWPDPKREKETEWITNELIDRELLKDSQKWIDIGSGSLARVFFEIIGCDNLPNMDTKFGGKTDTIVSIAYEDAVVEVDRIDDCLSPRWLPWTQRAFIFHMLHPSSPIFIGVFDYDDIGGNDFIGRVVVDITNLIPQTEYILNFNIRQSSTSSPDQKDSGTITVRLRIECHDERQLLKPYLYLPHKTYVNVKSKKEFSTVRAQVHGKYNYEAYSLTNLFNHITEILSYYNLACIYITEALVSVLLWRGTFPLQLPYSKSPFIYLPINSFILFISGVTIVEKPSLFPAYFFGFVTFVMFATMHFVQNNPSPWMKSKSFYDIVSISMAGKSLRPPQTIEPDQNSEECEKFETYWRKKKQDAEEDAQLVYDETLKLQEEQNKYFNEISTLDDDIATKSKDIVYEPFKRYIYPIQLYLDCICKYIRFFRYILMWKESYCAFMVTVISTVLCISCYFIPWGWIWLWLSRIIVWVILGPWMKLVDMYYYRSIEFLTPTERAAKRQEAYKKSKMYFSNMLSIARAKKENSEKLKAMKSILFGGFIIYVPTLKIDRSRDIPLSTSFATPYHSKAQTLAEISMEEAGQNRIHLPGQHLVGDMIPVPLEYSFESFTDASKGQPVGHTEDSSLSSYVKIGAVIVAASAFTWLCVPQIINLIPWLQTFIYKYVTIILQFNVGEYLKVIDTLAD